MLFFFGIFALSKFKKGNEGGKWRGDNRRCRLGVDGNVKLDVKQLWIIISNWIIIGNGG